MKTKIATPIKVRCHPTPKYPTLKKIPIFQKWPKGNLAPHLKISYVPANMLMSIADSPEVGNSVVSVCAGFKGYQQIVEDIYPGGYNPYSLLTTQFIADLHSQI